MRPRTVGCGTPTAYYRHLRDGEKPCEACTAAERARQAARPRRTTKQERARQTPLQPCGTYGGYQRHLRRGEKACDACLAAKRERNRADRAKVAS